MLILSVVLKSTLPVLQRREKRVMSRAAVEADGDAAAADGDAVEADGDKTGCAAGTRGGMSGVRRATLAL